MSEQDLHESIKEVQGAMQKALSEHERDMLGNLLLHMVKGTHPAPSSDLMEQAAEFEASHPKLAPSLREIIDVLNKLGI